MVYSRADYVSALDEFVPDVVLSDHLLPSFDSTEALKILTEKKLNIPFILVTGTVSEEFAVQILKEGADDYILKGKLTRLPSAIHRALEKRAMASAKENYQLLLENKIAEINTFIYRISHDLKAPIASTFGLIGIIKMKFPDHPVLEYINMIEKSNKKMDSILLSFAEVVRMSQENKAEEILNIHEITTEILDSLKILPRAQGITFDLNIAEEISTYGNKAMMISIFQNLVHNAINYRRNIAESFIKIRASEKDENIFIEVEDNGIGIDSDLLPRIFEMFFRATIASQGSGLGLYIVKNAVEKFGGTITVSSTPAVRTTFHIMLPKRKPPGGSDHS